MGLVVIAYKLAEVKKHVYTIVIKSFELQKYDIILLRPNYGRSSLHESLAWANSMASI